jgi:DNA polymerase III sliding clamp (beta) subunit (PCNA family)
MRNIAGETPMPTLEKTEITIQSSVVKKALKTIKHALPRDFACALLKQVGLLAKPSGIWLCGTDGHRMNMIRIDGCNGYDFTSGIDLNFFNELIRQDSKVIFGIGNINGWGNRIIHVNRKEFDPIRFGGYPDVMNILPVNSKSARIKFTKLQCKSFYEAVKNCPHLSDNNCGYVEIKPLSEALEINGVLFLINWSEGEKITTPLQFSRKYLTDMAKAMSSAGENLSLLLQVDERCLVHSEKFGYVIMPYRQKRSK